MRSVPSHRRIAFSFSWLLYVADMQERFWLEGARRVNTLTSRYVFSKVFPQNPSTTTSRRAPSCLFVEAPSKVSLVTGCRVGSVVTPWQVSFSREAVMSLSSLCLILG